MEDNKKKLYDALSEEYDLGTFEQFSSDIEDGDKRRKLYDATSGEYDYGDYDTFSSMLGFGTETKPVKPQEKPVEAVKEPENSEEMPPVGAVADGEKAISFDDEPVADPNAKASAVNYSPSVTGAGISDAIGFIRDRWNAAKSKREANKDAVSAYKEQMEMSKGRLETLNAGANEIAEHDKRLKTTKAEIEKENKALKVEYMALNNDVDALNKKIADGTATQEEIDSITARSAALDQKREALSAKIDGFNGDLAAYNDNVALYNQQYEELRKSNAFASTFEMADLQKELGEINRQIADLKANKKAIKADKTQSVSYGDRLSELEQKQDEVQKKLSNNVAYQAFVKESDEKTQSFIKSLDEVELPRGLKNPDAFGPDGKSFYGNEANFHINGIIPNKNLVAASHLAQQAHEVYTSPMKYTDEYTGMQAFGKGFGSRLKDADFWMMGFNTIADAPQVREVLEKYVASGASDPGLSDEEQQKRYEEVLDALPADQRKLLEAYFMYQNARGLRANDVMGTYTAGQGAADSAMYALEFGLTAGLGDVAIAGKSLNAATKALQKKLLASLMTKTPTTFIGKAGKLAAREVGAWSIEQLNTLGMTLTRTIALPNLYKAVAENATQLDDNGELTSMGKAVGDAWLDTSSDMFFENSGEAFQRFLGQVVNIPARALGRNLATGEAARLFREFGKSTVVGGMSKAAFSGPFEIYEEWKSAMFNQLIGRDPDAMHDFFKADNLLELTASFAPMTILQLAGGGIHSMAFNSQRNKAFANAAESERKLNEFLAALGVSEEAYTAMNEAVRGRQLLSDGGLSEDEMEALKNNDFISAKRGAEVLASILAKRTDRGDATYLSTMGELNGFFEDKTPQQRDMFTRLAMRYLGDVHKVHGFNGIYLGKIDARKEELRGEIEADVPGNSFYSGNKGNEVVQSVRLTDGSDAFIISESANSNGEMFAVVRGEDRVRTVTDSDIDMDSVNVLSLDEYLDGLVRAERQQADANHVQETVQQNIPNIQQQFVAGRKAQLPLGENGAMVEVGVVSVTPTNLIVEYKGQRPSFTWGQVSQMMTPVGTISQDSNAQGVQEAANEVALQDMKDNITDALGNAIDNGELGEEWMFANLFVENVDADGKGLAKVKVIQDAEHSMEMWIDYGKLLAGEGIVQATPQAEQASVEEVAPETTAEIAPEATETLSEEQQKELTVADADELLNTDPVAFAEAYGYNEASERLVGNRLRKMKERLKRLKDSQEKEIDGARKALAKYREQYNNADTVAGMEEAKRMMDRAEAELKVAEEGTDEMRALESDIENFTAAYDAISFHRASDPLAIINDDEGNRLSLDEIVTKVRRLRNNARIRGNNEQVAHYEGILNRIEEAKKKYAVQEFEAKPAAVDKKQETLTTLLSKFFLGKFRVALNIADFVSETNFSYSEAIRWRNVLSLPVVDDKRLTIKEWFDMKDKPGVVYHYDDDAITIAELSERFRTQAEEEMLVSENDDSFSERDFVIGEIRSSTSPSNMRDQEIQRLKDDAKDEAQKEVDALYDAQLDFLHETYGVDSYSDYEAIRENLIINEVFGLDSANEEQNNINFVEKEDNGTSNSSVDNGQDVQDDRGGEAPVHSGGEAVQHRPQSDRADEVVSEEAPGGLLGDNGDEHGAAQSASAEQAEPLRVIPSEISALADKIWQALGRAINIVSYATDLPANIAEDIIEARKRGEETYGFFDPRTRQAYIILESMDSTTRLLETIFHEVGTHKGLRAMLGDEGMDELCSKVFDTVMTDEERQEYLSYANVNGDNLRAAEEWIADRAYRLASDNNEKSRWERFVSAVMDILRKIGFDIPDTQNTLDEIGGMLRDAMAGFIEESQRLTGNNSADLAQIASERYDEIFGADGNEFMFSRKNGVRKTLLAIHNISSDKLKKALKLGGLANPSVAVIDTDRQSHNSYGEISFLLPKKMVDAKTGRNLGTWLADAYTASYPRVIKDYTNETAWRAMLLSIEDETMRERVRVAWLNYLDDPYIKDAMKWQFLYETGRNPEIVRHEDSYTREISDAVAELAGSSLMEALDDKEKATALLDIYMTTVEDDRKEAVRELMFTKEKESDVPFREANSFERNKRFRNQERDRVGFSTTLVRRFAEDVLRARRLGGQIDEYETTARASRFITENNLDKEMEAWLGRREDMLGVREKFFVKYTPSGNRVYWENTLDNVSRYMKSQGGSAVTGFAGMHRLVAKASPKVKSIAAIRKAQENLRDMDAHKDFYDMWQNAYRRLADALNIDSNNVFDDSGEYRLEEVINMADPRAYLLREYRKEVSDEWYQEFTELQYAIRNEFPAMYFETKFARPVYLNEFSGAIVPVDVDEEIRNAILASGIPVYEYSNGVEGSREAAVAKAAGDNDLYFSRKKSDDIFVSNAMAAVMGINTAKATPEQWIGMLTSKGGLKAGEDKWLGLSEWLKSSDKKTINKDEILTYIKNNQISVEETHYSDIEESDAFLSLKDQYSLEFNDMLRRKEEEQRDADEFIQEMEAKYGTEDWYDYIYGLYTDPREDDDVDIDDIRRDLQEAERFHIGRYGYYGENPFDSMSAMETFVDEYGDDFTLAFEDYRDEGILSVKDPMAAGALLGVEPIDDTRLSYVTGGLDDKREIALTVPTIEPYNQADTIHFGDAGEGRAVAWIRFGDTRFVMDHPAEDMEWVKVDGSNFVNGNDLYYPNGNRRSRNYIAFKKGLFVLYLGERPVRAFNTFEEAAEAYRESSLEPTRAKVLVIDEIQSKRHQDARENGYVSQREEGAKAKFEAAMSAVEDYKQSLLDKYNTDEMGLSRVITDEESKHWDELLKTANEASMYDHETELLYNVPDAPFEKNWHELAMKRMIRLAAEEGYDKIAWTNGDMQAERYNIGGVVDSIYIGKFRKNGKYAVTIYDKNSMPINHPKDAEGYDGVDDLAEVFGKDLATRLVEGYEALPQDKKDVGDSFKVDGDGLKIGGEGMRGFYDEILPRFVNKYGKKWGVKVSDITLPRLQNKGGWHSIDVTPEMKADVMNGQLMFSRSAVPADEVGTRYGLEPMDEEEYRGLIESGFLFRPKRMREPVDRYIRRAARHYFGRFNKNVNGIAITEDDSYYDPNERAIYVSVNRTTPLSLMTTLIHENIHESSVNDKDNNADRSARVLGRMLVEAVYGDAEGEFMDTVRKIWDYVSREYSAEDFYVQEEELAAHVLAYYLSRKKGNFVRDNLNETLKVYFDNIIERIGYGKGNETIYNSEAESGRGGEVSSIDSETEGTESEARAEVDEFSFSRRPVKSSEEIMSEAYDNATDAMKERIDEVGGVKNFLIENILYGTGNLVDLSWVNDTLERLAGEISRTDRYYEIEQLKYDLLKSRKTDKEDLYAKAVIAERTALQKELAEANRKHMEELDERELEESDFDVHDSIYPPERPSDDEFDYQSAYYDDFKRNSLELRSEIAHADNAMDNGEYTHEDVKSAYDAMSWILECREHWMKHHGVNYGEISEADVVKMVEAGMSEDNDIAANWNAEDKFLFDLIYPTVKKLHLSFRITDDYKKNVGGTYSLDRNEITISDSVFNSSSLGEFERVVLHEMIHAVTVYVLDGRWDRLTERQSQAADDLRAVFNMIVNDPDFEHEYGIKDVREMIAELSNPSFRDKLKKKSLWERIVDGIREIVMGLVNWDGPKFRKSNAYEISYRALTDILNDFNRSQYLEESLFWGRDGVNDEFARSTTPANSGQRIQNITNEQAIHQYTDAASSVRVRMKEILVDKFALVDELVKSIVDASGKVLGAGEHVVDIAKAASSMCAYEMQEFTEKIFKPMMDYIRDITKETDLAETDIEKYVAMKNGLERQTVLAVRDAEKMLKAYRDRNVRAENERYAQASKESVEGVEEEYKRRMDNEDKRYQDDLQNSPATIAAIDRKHNAMVKRIDTWRTNALNGAIPQAQVDAEHNTAMQNIEANYNAELSLIQSADEQVRMRSDIYAKARQKDYGAVRSWFAKYRDENGNLVDALEQKPGENFEEFNKRMRDNREIDPMYDDLAFAESELQKLIDAYERELGGMTDGLWDAIRKATDSTVQLQFEHHLIDEDTMESLIGANRMFQYYVPLRGFAEETAEELYDIQSLDHSDNFTPPLMSAKGRSSRADSPFGYIGAMHSSAAVQAFKNDIAMSLYNIVANRPEQSLVTIADIYYENKGVDADGKTIWDVVQFTPDPNKTDAENMLDRAAWIEQMDQMVEEGTAKRDIRDIDLRNAAIDPRKLADSKSLIRVRSFGKEISMKVNGDPRAAQILNGDEAVTNAKDDMGYLLGRAIRAIAQCFTSWAIPFWFTNLERDLIFGASQAYITGNREYLKAYRKNLGKSMMSVIPVFMSDDHMKTSKLFGALGKDFEEFAKYGGITGQTVVWNAERWNEEISTWNKRANQMVARKYLRNAWTFVMEVGEAIEQVSRFAAYMTAKEMGKSTDEAIADAKNITLNFNQKGTFRPLSWEESGELVYRDRKGFYHRLKDGGKASEIYRGMLCLASRYSWARFFYVFYNAATQGLYKFYENLKNHPGKTGVVLGIHVLGGFMSGLLNGFIFGMGQAGDGDGDDEEQTFMDLVKTEDKDYLHTNTWRKHNRFMLRISNGRPLFLQWSLPQEYVPFFGLGEDLAEVMRHNLAKGKMVTDFASAMAGLLPVDIVTPIVERDLEAFERPTVLAPFIENTRNENSFGSPVYYEAPRAKGTLDTQPGYQKATYSTWAFMTDLAKLQNRAFGGGDEDAAYSRVFGNVSMNPAKWQNVIEGIGGTTASSIFDLGDTIYRLLRGGSVEMGINTAPVIDRLLYDAGARMRDPYTTEQYERYIGVAKAMEENLKKYNVGTEDENFKETDRLRKEKSYQYYLIYTKYKDLMNADEKAYRSAEGQEEKMAKARLRDKAREEFIKECIALDYKRNTGLLGKD